MICIQRGHKGICYSCREKPVTKVINGMGYCSDCADTVLIKIIGKCSKAVKGAKVRISIVPVLKERKGKNILREI
jgi:hypothetical protein